MAAPASRLDRDACAGGFVRAAQYLANMLAGADVLAESRELIRAVFGPDVVCFCDPARCAEDCGLPEHDRAALRRAVAQVLETGLMAIEDLGGSRPVATVVLPVGVRGRAEAALVVGYHGEQTVPPHALETLLGVAGLVGATLARQRADRELLALAEERAGRAIAEVTERRMRLLADASQALFASFDYEATLAALARRLVPELAEWCAIELRDEEPPATTHTVALVHVDRATAELVREGGTAGDPAIAVTIASRGGVLGTITLGAPDPKRGFAAEDLALAEEIGRRAATAIENARLYRQAQQAIAVRDQFLAVASHELKTPLTGLMLVIQGVERSLERLASAPPLMRSKVAAIARQARRLNVVVTNLLDVARIQAGRLHVSLEPVDLCAVVREVAERHAQEASHAGCALEVAAEGTITGAWDPSGLDHVVSNLVSNAIKYGAGQPISIRVDADADTARLSVADGGIGIAAGDHERIFKRFERAVPATSFGGIGLGLWIARDMVRRFGGTIRVESRLGEGARFTVELPIRPATEPSAR